MQTLLIVFVALAAVAILIQAAILAALYIAVKKTSDRVETMGRQVQLRLVPIFDSTREILSDLTPKVKLISADLVDTTAKVKAQIERLDSAISSIADRAQMQVDRADHLVSRTIDKVEGTTNILQKAVLSPVQQVAGVINGLTVGLTSLFRRRQQAPNGSAADGELFI